MSASTRDETLKLNKPGRRLSTFWMISIALHAAAIGAVIFIAPVREIVLVRERKEPEIITRGDDLEKIIDDIRDLTAERLRGRVQILHAGQDRMATNFSTLNRHFQPFQSQQEATALARLQRYATDTLQRQQTVLTALAAARDKNEHAAAARVAQENLSRVLTGQDEIRRGIQLLKIDTPELMALQQKAEEMQHQASQFVRWMDDNVDGIEQDQKRIEEERAKAKELAPKVEELTARHAELETARAAAETLKKDLEEQRKAAEVQKRELDKNKDREGSAAQTQKINELATQIRTAQGEMDKARNAGNDTKRELDRTQNALRAANEQVEAAEKRIVERTAKRDELTLTGINVQNAAMEQQKQVLATVLRENGGAQ